MTMVAAILSALLIMLMGLFRFAHAQCMPPVSSGVNDMKVAFHETTNTDVCHLQSPPFDNARMDAYCQAFCATGGVTTGLPMQLGNPEYGFSLEQMRTVCSSVAKIDGTLISFCGGRQEALREIEVKAAEFVAGVDVVKAEEIAFRALVLNHADTLRAELISDDFRHNVDRVATFEKIQVLRSRFERFKGQLVRDGGAAKDMLAALGALRNSSDALQDAVDRHLPLFEDFVSRCNQMLIGLGPQLESVLDICGQKSLTECIEVATARHVGCCCGLNPVVAPTLTIDGLNASLFAGQGFVAPARRLEGSSAINICAQAKQESQNGVAQARDRTTTHGFPELLEEQEQLLRSSYPEYFSRCQERARSLGAAEVKRVPPSEHLARPSAASEPAARASTEAEEATEAASDALRGSESRRLQQHLNCVPPVDVFTGLKVAFSNTTEPDTCRLQNPPVGNAEMQAQCAAFCGATSMPMLIGSQAYGFNLSEANSICLPPGGILVHNDLQLEQCSSWSFGFHDVELKTADFTAQLDVFTHMQLLYVARLRNVSIAIHDFAQSREFQNEMARTTDKVGTFITAIKDKVDAFNRSSVVTGLQGAIDELRQRAQALGASLQTNIGLIQRFLEECNELHVGTGPNREYLLDVCPQQNVECIDHALAGHVSCCCAYHPFTTFGEVVPQATINGINGFAPPARVAPGGGRNLQEGGVPEKRTVLDICAKAWTDAGEQVAGLLTCTKETNQADNLRAYLEAMKARYGEEYCGYEGYWQDVAAQCPLTHSVVASSSWGVLPSFVLAFFVLLRLL